ncbi:hypothetical protein ACHAWF_002485 [Thalassiosira exigua]
MTTTWTSFLHRRTDDGTATLLGLGARPAPPRPAPPAAPVRRAGPQPTPTAANGMHRAPRRSKETHIISSRPKQRQPPTRTRQTHPTLATMLFRNLVVAALSALAAIDVASADSILEIAASADDFSTLAAAVSASEPIKEALAANGTYTVFAPVNAAFDALPEGLVAKLLESQWAPQLQDLLQYHVLGSVVTSADLKEGMFETLNGEKVDITLTPPMVNDATILVDSVVDVMADNGVIHGIDKVLVPPSVLNNIVAVAQGNEAFKTLVQAVVAAGLVDALSSDELGPLTVFAPTDDAFAALPEGTLASLLEPDNKDKLIDILQYHVVPGNAVSSGLSSGMVDTLLGEKLDIEVADGGVTVNGATVTAADILANNGVVHVIDQVLIPAEDMKADAEDETMTATTTPPAAETSATTVPETVPAPAPADAPEESGAARGVWGIGAVLTASASLWAL